MKELISIVLLSFFGIGSVLGQAFQPIKDSTNLKKCNNYINHILALEKDTTIHNEAPTKYDIVYRTSCSYYDTFTGSDYKSVRYLSGKFFTNNLPKDQASNSKDSTRQQDLYICADNPSILIGDDSFSVSKQNSTLSKNLVITNIYLLSNKGLFYSFDMRGTAKWMGISYNNGKYLIIECTYLSEHLSSGTSGIIETLFLEKRE